MNREDIIRMAREAAEGMEGFTPKVKAPSGAVLDFYERFAALVRADEREGCAALCDQLSDSSRDLRFGTAIRERT